MPFAKYAALIKSNTEQDETSSSNNNTSTTKVHHITMSHYTATITKQSKNQSIGTGLKETDAGLTISSINSEGPLSQTCLKPGMKLITESRSCQIRSNANKVINLSKAHASMARDEKTRSKTSGYELPEKQYLVVLGMMYRETNEMEHNCSLRNMGRSIRRMHCWSRTMPP